MFRNLYHEIKAHQDLKKEVLQFSVLSILYFVLYTLLSAFLGMFNHDALTVAVFWVLNLISTYVYMRFFFQMIARSRDEERVVGLKPCLRMLVIESVMFAFSVLMYYAFVCFIELYLLLALISYVYLFFCVALQLFCFYEIYEGTGGFLKVVTSALRQMAVMAVRSWQPAPCCASAISCCMSFRWASRERWPCWRRIRPC